MTNYGLKHSCLGCLLAAFAGSLLVPCARADYYAARNGQAPSAPYTTWNSAALHIQDAVNAATNGATVWVGAGRYTLPPNATNDTGSNVVFINRLLTLRSSNGVPADTFIDGQGTNRGIMVNYSSGSATYRMVIDGFTITNCWATNCGGGIYWAPGAWTGIVQNCVICDNTVGWGTACAGGGMYANVIDSLTYIISNCVFRNNRALSVAADGLYGQGGAALLGTYSAGSGKLLNCLVESNAAGVAGAGLYFGYGGRGLSLENCVIRDNYTMHSRGWATDTGGGIQLNGCVASMRNCLVCNNYGGGGNGGGGIACQRQGSSSLIELYNCTIVSNRVGGIFIRAWGAAQSYNPSFLIYNSIIQSNTSYNISATPAPGLVNTIVNSCWYPSNGANAALLDIGSVNPPAGFVNFDARDFRLAWNSPCVNAGTNQDWMANYPDLDGNRRIRYGTVDLGACEMIHDATIYRFR